MAFFETLKRFGRSLVTPGQRGTPQKGTTRRYFGHFDLRDFIEGRKAIAVDSSWVSWMVFLRGLGDTEPRGILVLLFHDGHVQPYGPVGPEVVGSLARADSKGKWVHEYILGQQHPDGTWEHKIPKVKGNLGDRAAQLAVEMTQ